MGERFIERRLRAMETADHARLIATASKMEGVLKLSGGDPDFDTPRHIKVAAIEALGEGWTHYPPNHGLPGLRQAIAQYHGKYGVNWRPSEVTVTGGSNMALFKALTATLNPGEEVILIEPYYMNYSVLLDYVGAHRVPVPLVEDEGYRLDAEALKRAVSSRTKMILLCNPNNPTGTVYTEAELEAVADAAVDHDLLVVTDECYNELIWDGGKHHSISALRGMKGRTIVCLSFSKTFSMTGWRLGCVIADEPITAHLRRQPLGARVSTFVQKAGIAALEGSWEPVREMHSELDRRRRFLVPRLNEIEGLRCHLPEGSIFTFPSIDGTGTRSVEFAESLLKEKKILVRPGIAFGETGEYHLRIPLIRPIDVLEGVAEAIEDHVDSLGR